MFIPKYLPAFRQRQPNWLKPIDHAASVRGDAFPEAFGRLHLSLLPAPYLGDVASADIFILMMNPGFAPADYFAEDQPAWRSRLLANLAQQRVGSNDFPNPVLDPAFAWTGAFTALQHILADVVAVEPDALPPSTLPAHDPRR